MAGDDPPQVLLEGRGLVEEVHADHLVTDGADDTDLAGDGPDLVELGRDTVLDLLLDVIESGGLRVDAVNQPTGARPRPTRGADRSRDWRCRCVLGSRLAVLVARRDPGACRFEADIVRRAPQRPASTHDTGTTVRAWGGQSTVTFIVRFWSPPTSISPSTSRIGTSARFVMARNGTCGRVELAHLDQSRLERLGPGEVRGDRPPSRS